MVIVVVNYIRAEFKKMLDELEWMDPVTKAKALSKLEKITPNIAYPKEILDDKMIDEFYSGLEIKNDSYLLNSLRLKKFRKLKIAEEFRKKIDKKDWRTHGGAAVVNAFYNPYENWIEIPAGILGGVFFEVDRLLLLCLLNNIQFLYIRPKYMNLGGIGFVVGHKITHGFLLSYHKTNKVPHQDVGSQFDGEGNLMDWWQPETKEKYLERTQCIIDQYSNYTVEVRRTSSLY